MSCFQQLRKVGTSYAHELDEAVFYPQVRSSVSQTACFAIHVTQTNTKPDHSDEDHTST